MPELPEVETIRRQLEEHLLGDPIVSLRFLDRAVLCGASENTFQKAVSGQSLQGFDRHGKYLFFRLSKGGSLVLHLRMSGRLRLVEPPGKARGPSQGAEKGEPPGFEEPPPRLTFVFASGKHLHFYDVRRFGQVFWVPAGKRFPILARLGPDALDGLDPEDFARALRSHRGRVKALLMDQQFLSGVGNIYAQEALFRAGIRPDRAAHRLRKDQAQKLYLALRDTLRIALYYRGSTSRNYRDLLGQAGEAHRYHLVYGRAGKRCLACGSFLKSARVSGRGTTYCPSCQR